MKLRTIITIAFISLGTLMTMAKPQFGRADLFNDNWKFILSDEKEGAKSDYDDSKWKSLRLPHDWSVEGVYSPDKSSCTGYLPGGIAWYRKTFSVPSTENGNKAYIYFEGVYNNSEVFINGQSLGKRPGGYVSFMYDLTPYLKFGEENLLSVRVDHSEDADSRWYSGSGIYRDVYLVYASPVHIGLWGVFFKGGPVSEKKRAVTVDTQINNTLPSLAKVKVRHEIIDPTSRKVVIQTSANVELKANSSNTSSQEMTLLSPRLWSLEDPFLYVLKTEVLADGKVIDSNEQRVGIRDIAFDPDKGFALNGDWMKVKGVCIHHDAGCLGSAVPREVWKRRLLTLKEMGCNAVRMSHNPQAPDVYELCDEIGMLVMDEAFDEWEFPKRKWITGWNKGTPGFQGSASFFNEWSDRDIRDMVMRDRNHPSVIMWSIGNEVDYPNDPYSHPVLDHAGINQPVRGGFKPDSPHADRLGAIAKRLASVVRGADSTRPVTAALAGVVMSNETEYPYALDITGYNYTEDRYAQDHAKYPKRVIFGSENGHSMQSWKVVRDNEYIFGQFLWTGIDYLGESGPWPTRGFYSGLLDFGGFLKPRGHFRQALWSEKPVAYLGTYPMTGRRNNISMDAWPIWNYREGELIRVVCYTNAIKARLLLNGEQVGDLKEYDDNTGIIYWDIPFKEGKLEVSGLGTDGKEICRYALESSGRPYTLAVSSDVKSISKERGVAHVTVQVVDDKGIPVMLSDDEITCTVEGPAELLGLEASNNKDMGDYNDNVQRAFHGRLLAYIRANGSTGDVKLTFKAPWLKDATLTIRTEE